METETPRHYPLPHPENIASQDVMRIRESIEKIDADITENERNQKALQKQLKQHLFEQLIDLWRSPYEFNSNNP